MEIKIGPSLTEAGGVDAADFAHEARWFYDRALCAALGGACATAAFTRFQSRGPADASDIALLEQYARLLTERRFGVKLVLPGDSE